MKLTSADLPNISGIYKITCLVNLKSYIGQSKNIRQRVQSHLRSSICSTCTDYDVPIHAAFRKYGIENFEIDIVEECESSLLNEREVYWIAFYKTYIHMKNSQGYNVTEGGKQSTRRLKLTPTIVQDIYECLKANILTNSEIAKKFNICSDTVKRLNSGKLCYNSTINYPIRNHKVCSNSLKFGNYYFTGTAVQQIDKVSGEILNTYPSAFAAALALGNATYNKHIAHCCAEKRKSAYGFKWQFVNITEQDWKKLFNK